jgi:hypothetical protein
MVAMRSVKAAIAQSIKMRDLINSNALDHSLGDKAPVGWKWLAATRPPRGSVITYSPTAKGCGWERRLKPTGGTPEPIGGV